MGFFRRKKFDEPGPNDPMGSDDNGLKSRQEFKEIREKIVSKYPPSDGINLQGMATDLDNIWLDDDGIELFNEESILTAPEGYQPKGNDELLTIEYDLKNERDLDRAAVILERFWLERCGYRYFKAHFLEKSNDRIVLHFITQIGLHGFYVDGRMIARRFSENERKNIFKSHLQEAHEYFKEKVSTPDDPNAWIGKAAQLYKERDYDELIRYLDKIIESQPPNHSIWYYKGCLLYVLDKKEEADVCFSRADSLCDPPGLVKKRFFKMPRNNV